MTKKSPPAKKIDSSLFTRVWAAAIFAPLVLGAVYLGGPLFTLVMAAAAAVGVQEWGRMAMADHAHDKRLLPYAMASAAGSVIFSAVVGNPASAFWVLLSCCLVILYMKLSQAAESLGHLVSGMIYITFSMQVIVWIRNGSDYGLYNMLTLLLIIWASDISAYFTGKLIGGPKLAPEISPKKTWAGFIGSSVGAGIAAMFLAGLDVRQYFSAVTIGQIPPVGYFVLGFILAMFGQAGDLFKSIFKRHYGIKDMGTLIPGHGGLMDRIDALLMAALIFGSLVFLLQ